MIRLLILACSVFFSLPALALAPVQKVTSSNGIEAWLIEDHTNPIVALRFGFKGGSALDPKGKEGLARLASATMDEGAGPWDSQSFQARLNDLSVTLRFDTGMDRFGGQILSLRENLEPALEMLKQALTVPRFDKDAVERIRAQILADLRQREEDPGTVAALTLFKSILPDHPYARGSKGTVTGVQNITTDDLHNFVKTRLGQSNLKIGVSGDITPDELKELLDKTFGAIAPQAQIPPLPDATLHLNNKRIVIEKPVPQSSIVFAQQGIDRHHKDFYAAYVLNYILGGGGFSSRLTTEVREKRGLVYSVYSYLNNYDKANFWIIGAATQNARVKETLDVVRTQWEKAAKDGVTKEEVQNAKTYLSGSFALRFKSSDTIAAILLGMQMDNLPIDFLEQRNKQVEAVTLDDVNRVAKTLLTPDKLKAVVVGQPVGL